MLTRELAEFYECRCNICGRVLVINKSKDFELSKDTINLFNCEDCTYQLYQQAVRRERYTELVTRRRDRNKLLSNANIPPRFSQLTEEYRLKQVTDWLSSARNIVLSGGSFSGKTSNICLSLSEKVIEYGEKVFYFQSLSALANFYLEHKFSFWEWLSRFETVCIDDIAVARSYSDLICELLYQLVNSAHDGSLKTNIWLVGAIRRGDLDKFGYGESLRNRLRYSFDCRAIIDGKLERVTV